MRNIDILIKWLNFQFNENYNKVNLYLILQNYKLNPNINNSFENYWLLKWKCKFWLRTLQQTSKFEFTVDYDLNRATNFGFENCSESTHLLHCEPEPKNRDQFAGCRITISYVSWTHSNFNSRISKNSAVFFREHLHSKNGRITNFKRLLKLNLALKCESNKLEYCSLYNYKFSFDSQSNLWSCCRQELAEDIFAGEMPLFAFDNDSQ